MPDSCVSGYPVIYNLLLLFVPAYKDKKSNIQEEIIGENVESLGNVTHNQIFT